MSKTDDQHVVAIMSAIRDLNEAVGAASKSGLEVSIAVTEFHAMAVEGKRIQVSASIKKNLGVI